jgi:hypothetical protein
MDFTKAVTIVITGIFPRTVAYTFVIVAPCLQAAVDIILPGRAAGYPNGPPADPGERH